ncbi:MAG: DinB family protein [Anaerolineae bacterium]|nr:DinB family protein [Anaerolineae bacterium]
MNRRILSHIVGIERWGQRRLSVFLGEPFVDEEYNIHRPPREASWSELRAQFHETRAQTLVLIDRIAAADPRDQRVLHNQWGLLSARGWLNYLNVHARGESLKMR